MSGRGSRGRGGGGRGNQDGSRGRGRGAPFQGNRGGGNQRGGGGGGKGSGMTEYPGDGGATAPPGQELINTFETDRKPFKTSKAYNPSGGAPIPKQRVTDAEKAYDAGVSTDLARLNLKDGFLPLRPGHGTSGTALQVFANFFELDIPVALMLCQFSISTPKELDNKKRKKLEIVAAAIKLIPGFEDFDGKYATDHATVLISIGAIEAIISAAEEADDKGVMAPTLEVTVPDIRQAADEDTPPAASDKKFKIKFRYIRDHNFKDILSYLRSTTGAQQNYDEKYQTMQILNIFFGYFARNEDKIFMKSSGQRNKFWHQDTERVDIGRMLQGLKGFVSSIRPATGRYLLNVNNASIAGYKPVNLLDLMLGFRQGPTSNEEISRFIRGVRVRRLWLEKKNKKGVIVPKDKSVWGFAAKRDKGSRMINGQQINTVRVPKDGANANEVTFRLDDGSWVSVAKFFQDQYNYTIKTPQAPVVNLGSSTAPVYVPAERCLVMDGQDYRLKLDGTQTDNMLKFAVNQPWFNFAYIEQRAPPVLGLQAPLLKAAGITVQPKLITVNARLLPPPTIYYGGNKSMQPRDGGWNMAANKCITPGSVPNDWRMIVVDSGSGSSLTQGGKASNLAAQLAKDITDEWKKLGIMNLRQPTVASVPLPLNSDESTFDNAISNFLKAYEKMAFLFIVLPKKLPEWQYKRIKYWADVKYGIATVCVAADKVLRAYNDPKGPNSFYQYAANIGLKVNAKFGGSNQGPDSKKLGFITKGKTMLVGLDVTHPAPGSKKSANSVAAMVANIDGTLGQWPAVLELNGERVEEVSTVQKMLESRLDLWMKKGKNKVLPENIMFFRDGVSEGQFKRVLDIELKQIRNAIKTKYSKGKAPRLFIAVCGKRHQVRFAPARNDDCDGGNNCKAGLVVDSGITETKMWDFYLQAHKAIQGTARSCHYTVIYDEIFSDPVAVKEFGRGNVGKADLLQEMCNALAYTYPRATKAVSLSTPAKLADLACDRARAYVSRFIDSTATNDDDDASSTTSDAKEAARRRDVAIQTEAIAVHNRLKDTMFYI